MFRAEFPKDVSSKIIMMMTSISKELVEKGISFRDCYNSIKHLSNDETLMMNGLSLAYFIDQIYPEDLKNIGNNMLTNGPSKFIEDSLNQVKDNVYSMSPDELRNLGILDKNLNKLKKAEKDMLKKDF